MHSFPLTSHSFLKLYSLILKVCFCLKLRKLFWFATLTHSSSINFFFLTLLLCFHSLFQTLSLSLSLPLYSILFCSIVFLHLNFFLFSFLYFSFSFPSFSCLFFPFPSFLPPSLLFFLNFRHFVCFELYSFESHFCVGASIFEWAINLFWHFDAPSSLSSSSTSSSRVKIFFSIFFLFCFCLIFWCFFYVFHFFISCSFFLSPKFPFFPLSLFLSISISHHDLIVNHYFTVQNFQF